MTKKIKQAYLLLASLLTGLLYVPIAFGKSMAEGYGFFAPLADSTEKKITEPAISYSSPVTSVYDSLHLNLAGLSQQAFNYAMQGLDKLVEEGRLLNDSIISIIDFSLPSNKKRLFILDVRNYKMLFNTWVAHGKNTGKEWASDFSNQSESYKSSPGFYITGEPYNGKNGFSLKLEGIERGINNNAFERGIVIHGAPYVSKELINVQGYIGRSQGCPAVSPSQAVPIIQKIKNGSCLFIYHPCYIKRSTVLD